MCVDDILVRNAHLPDSVIYRIKKDLTEQKRTHVRIGHLFDMHLNSDYKSLAQFRDGFKSGIAQIARTSYNFPTEVDCKDWKKRGYRYAWLCHLLCRKFGMHDLPEMEFILK